MSYIGFQITSYNVNIYGYNEHFDWFQRVLFKIKYSQNMYGYYANFKCENYRNFFRWDACKI